MCLQPHGGQPGGRTSHSYCADLLVDMRLLDCVVLGGGHLTARNALVPRNQHSLQELCSAVEVTLLRSSFSTPGNCMPNKSKVVSLRAAFDVSCMTSPCSYLLATVKSSREAIKNNFKKLPC